MDSWIDVVMAIDAARGGSPRLSEMAAMRAALATCSGLNVTDPAEVVAVQLGENSSLWSLVQTA